MGARCGYVITLHVKDEPNFTSGSKEFNDEDEFVFFSAQYSVFDNLSCESWVKKKTH